MQNLQPAPPASNLLWKESRALLDAARMVARSIQPVRRIIEGDPVIVLPGFGAGERSMRPLRNYLRRHRLHVEDWGQGTNKAGLDLPHSLDDLGPTWQAVPLPVYRGEGGVAYLCDRMVHQVRERSEALDSKIALVGWSLGGTIAREVARDLPDRVSQVITLGSPVVGGPKYTAAARTLTQRGLDMDWIETEVRRREERPITVPVTAVVSPTDAIVGFGAAHDRFNDTVRHVVLDVPHLGMGLNPQVWDVILEALETPTG
ncbi:MAG: alpha/beta fold hydrolase [Xanthomonadales bacterium]|nr:alpha/beta fold hydrolase [Xanthomonadales bacterium]